MQIRGSIDLLVEKSLTGWNIWQVNDVVASTNSREFLDIIIAGATANRLSVWDASNCRFMTGTVDQLGEG